MGLGRSGPFYLRPPLNHLLQPAKTFEYIRVCLSIASSPKGSLMHQTFPFPSPLIEALPCCVHAGGTHLRRPSTGHRPPYEAQWRWRKATEGIKQRRSGPSSFKKDLKWTTYMQGSKIDFQFFMKKKSSRPSDPNTLRKVTKKYHFLSLPRRQNCRWRHPGIGSFGMGLLHSPQEKTVGIFALRESCGNSLPSIIASNLTNRWYVNLIGN